jgi:hypothetical protein
MIARLRGLGAHDSMKLGVLGVPRAKRVNLMIAIQKSVSARQAGGKTSNDSERHYGFYDLRIAGLNRKNGKPDPDHADHFRCFRPRPTSIAKEQIDMLSSAHGNELGKLGI